VHLVRRQTGLAAPLALVENKVSQLALEAGKRVFNDLMDVRAVRRQCTPAGRGSAGCRSGLGRQGFDFTHRTALRLTLRRRAHGVRRRALPAALAAAGRCDRPLALALLPRWRS
jgi:hypothetical protein